MDLKELSFAELSKRLGGVFDEDDDQRDDLFEELRRRQLAALPTPTCCKAAQEYPTIMFSVDVYDQDSREAEGKWTTAHLKVFQEQGLRERRDYFKHMPEPKFCNYCGLSLPKMARKKAFPKNTCVVKDGGYYCSTCKERLNACRCLPPEFAWEPV